MLDSAILNHAARIVSAVTSEVRADAALRHYFLETRRLGPRDKRAISRAVFAYFRWMQWLDPRASLQKQVAQSAELHETFARDPKSVKPETLAARAVPEWLREEMDLPTAYLRQLQHDQPLWLRARPGTAATLARELGDCSAAGAAADAAVVPSSGSLVPSSETEAEPESRNRRVSALAHDALRYTGTHDLFLTQQFQDGAFEIQDLSSQLVAIACAPQPGQTWWDACAGEGGKTLHLAGLMENKGLVWASDRSARRLEILKRRAARAEVFNYRGALWDGSARLPTKTKFDGILVDAPCSGVGTWQRNPHARWTTSPNDVRELAATQLTLLSHVAGSLKPGGRLVYAVCTLTRQETSAVVEKFSAVHPELEPSLVFPQLAAQTLPQDAQRALLPHELNANGMFIAAWTRKK